MSNDLFIRRAVRPQRHPLSNPEPGQGAGGARGREGVSLSALRGCLAAKGGYLGANPAIGRTTLVGACLVVLLATEIWSWRQLMNYCKSAWTVTAILVSAAITFPLMAEDDKDAKKESVAKPTEPDMMAMMMEMAKPGEQHKRLQEMVGTWSYVTKFWMTPEAPPNESSGTAVTRAVMDGRYFISDHTGKIQMPGPDGKMIDLEFKGMAVEGYDNAKKKFVSSWIDNMGTGIMNSEGTFDPATKTLTSYSDYEPMPGRKTKIRQVAKTIDKDHHTLEFFEDRGGKEVRTMEISYSRKS